MTATTDTANIVVEEEVTPYDWACVVALVKRFADACQIMLDVYFHPESASLTTQAERKISLARCDHFTTRLLRGVLFVHGVQTDECTPEGRARVWFAINADNVVDAYALARAEAALKNILVPVSSLATPDHVRMAECMVAFKSIMQSTATAAVLHVKQDDVDDQHFFNVLDMTINALMEQIGIADDPPARLKVTQKVNKATIMFAIAAADVFEAAAKGHMATTNTDAARLCKRIVARLSPHSANNNNSDDNSDSDSGAGHDDDDSDGEDTNTDILNALARFMALKHAMPQHSQ